MSARDLVRRLGEEERAFRGTLFLAPVLPDGRVRVRIAGVVCELTVRAGATGPAAAPGWAVCRALDTAHAETVEPAEPARVREFLRHFPALRAVLVSYATAAPAPAPAPAAGRWLGAAAHPADRRLRVDGLFPVLLAVGVREFDAAILRFDGGGFLFEDRDRRRDPAIADYLRESLAALRPAEDLRRRGLTAAERGAYAWRLARRRDELQPPLERRLESALGHAGARLEGYVERGAEVTVTYRVDGRSLTSVVRRDGFAVVNAGMCLDGGDRAFDLASLVSVVRSAPR